MQCETSLHKGGVKNWCFEVIKFLKLSLSDLLCQTPFLRTQSCPAASRMIGTTVDSLITHTPWWTAQAMSYEGLCVMREPFWCEIWVW